MKKKIALITFFILLIGQNVSSNTVYVIEKPVETQSSPMMASAGGSSKKMNFQQEVKMEQTLMKLQSVSTLKYT